jgi:23S rRNA pseudouridine1911/1915/1917 synthase
MKPPPPLTILLDTPDHIAVDKPAGLAAIPGRGESDSVLERLARQVGLASTGGGDPRVRVVHRLDKDTSGVMLFAKNAVAQRALSHQFQNNRVDKEYLAIVVNAPRDDEGVIEANIGVHAADRRKMAVLARGGRPAVTAWRVQRRFGSRFALLVCFPKTGKTHQIRVHLAHAGHPLAVDPVYNAPHGSDLRDDEPPPPAGLFLSRFKRGYRAKRGADERPLIGRLTLHARRLAFDDLSGARITVTCDPPKDFRAAVNQLSKIW